MPAFEPFARYGAHRVEELLHLCLPLLSLPLPAFALLLLSFLPLLDLWPEVVLLETRDNVLSQWTGLGEENTGCIQSSCVPHFGSLFSEPHWIDLLMEKALLCSHAEVRDN